MPAVVPAVCEGAGLLPGLGVLTSVITPELVDEAVELAGCREERRRLLPARVMVYFVLGMCLLSGEDSVAPPGYRSVMRSLSHGVRHRAGLALPSAAALCRRRRLLGAKALAFLLERLAGPLAAPGEQGSFAFGLRVVAWDSTSVDVPGTPANEAAFGRPGVAAGARAPAPQLRLLALAECGTHALIDAAFDGFATTSELALAPRLLAALRPGMLLLADRNFRGHELWSRAAAAGAELCWRAPAGFRLEPVQVLGDGSWTSLLLTPAHAQRGRRELGKRGITPQGTLVRVIDYHVTVAARDGTHRRTERFRLVTTILDPARAPAAALAALYHQRWEIEGGFLELKARLKGSGLALRSRDPEMAAQEMLAFLCVQQALAILEHQAAAQAGTDPDRLSFTVTIRVARDHAREQHAVLTPEGLAAATRAAITDMLASLLPARRRRQCPRQQKPGPPRYPKGNDTTPTHGSITCEIEVRPPPTRTA